MGARAPGRRVALLAALVALLAGCAGGPADEFPAPEEEPEQPREEPRWAQPGGKPLPAAPPPPRGSVTVAKVVDGDTVDLRDGRTVRLVQIDTPEVFGGAECGGAMASAALKRMLPAGTRVRLAPEPASDSTDRYGRLLRYLLVGRRNLNVAMVRGGWAAPYFYGGERGRYASALLAGANAARARGIGIWGTCPNAVLDAQRGVSTGALGGGGAAGTSDAAAGAGTINNALPAAPPYPPDVDCGDLAGPVRVTPDDPHRLDRDDDGVGCD